MSLFKKFAEFVASQEPDKPIQHHANAELS